MKKRLRLLFIILFLVIAAAVGLYFGINAYNSPARMYEENWKLNLPQGITQKYDVRTPPDFFGEGYHYTVYQLKSQDVSFLKNTSKNDEFEKNVSSILNQFDVKKDWYPDFSHNYLWKEISKDDDTLYIIYDLKTNLLYLVQIIM